MPQPITIVHLDRNEAVRNALPFLLKNIDDMQLLASFESEQQLQQRMEELKPDILIFDVPMPLPAALGHCRLVHEQFPAIPKIIYTYHKEPYMVRRLVEMQVDGYLEQNVSPQELIEGIRAVHRGANYYCRCCRRFVNTHRHKPIVFSNTELEVLRLVCLEWSTERIAKHLNKTESCISSYRCSIKAKSGTVSVGGLIVFAIANGLISWEELEQSLKDLTKIRVVS